MPFSLTTPDGSLRFCRPICISANSSSHCLNRHWIIADVDLVQRTKLLTRPRSRQQQAKCAVRIANKIHHIDKCGSGKSGSIQTPLSVRRDRGMRVWACVWACTQACAYTCQCPYLYVCVDMRIGMRVWACVWACVRHACGTCI